jgi:hypothetical protein
MSVGVMRDRKRKDQRGSIYEAEQPVRRPHPHPPLASHGRLAEGRSPNNQELGYPMRPHDDCRGTFILAAHRSQLTPQWLCPKPILSYRFHSKSRWLPHCSCISAPNQLLRMPRSTSSVASERPAHFGAIAVLESHNEFRLLRTAVV